MNNKIKHLAMAGALITLMEASNAATISVLDMTPTSTSISGFTVTGGTLVGSTRTYTLTQTADLDGGSVDDTLSFDLIYEAYTGSTYAAGDVTLGTTSTPNGNNINWHSNEFTTGDTLSLEVANISYTDGEGDETLAFKGFTSMRPAAVTSIGTPTGDIDYYVGLIGATTVTIDPTAEASLTSNGASPTVFLTAADGPVRLRNLDFQFETSQIPEPSSTALLCLGGLALILRRRK